MRVEVCDQCKGYLKVIVSFTPTPTNHLLIEDLATLHMDYIAQARGYKRAPVGPAKVGDFFPAIMPDDKMSSSRKVVKKLDSTQRSHPKKNPSN